MNNAEIIWGKMQAMTLILFSASVRGVINIYQAITTFIILRICMCVFVADRARPRP